MKTHDLLQGSPAWLAHRRHYRNASDAPAMMGCSPYKTRSELLDEMSTGLASEVDDATQRRFDDGHKFEALARPLAAEAIGEALFPMTGTSGTLGASFDGLTMGEDVAYEHKTLNDDLRAAMFEGCTGSDLPLAYRVQMEQQCMVSGCERVLFMATKWKGDVCTERRQCWYTPDPALAAAIADGWTQFDVDLTEHTPVAKTLLPVAQAVTALPAVTVHVAGTITIVDNFAVFEKAARDFIANKLIRVPETDQHFADLDLQIKAMKNAEASLDTAEQQMLAQIDAVDSRKKVKDMLLKLIRDNRLMAEKLLASRKDQIRIEQVQRGKKALAEHVDALNKRLGKLYMPVMDVDFAGAIKSKRTVDSLREAIDLTLAQAKITASATADKIQTNLETLRTLAANHVFLFNDAAQLVQKAPEDVTLLVQARITEHDAKEAARLEAQRETIRQQEREKLEVAQRQAQLEEDETIARIWYHARRIEGSDLGYVQKAISYFEAGPGDYASDPRPRVAAAVADARAEMQAKLEAAKAHRAQAEADFAARTAAQAAITQAATPAPAPTAEPTPAAAVTPLQASPSSAPSTPLAASAAATAVDDGATVNVGQINACIAPLSIDARGLETLGFKPQPAKGAARLYRECDLPLMVNAMREHLAHALEPQGAEA